MDYAAVAGSIVLGIPGVRACLVVSADGLPLAVHPPAEEEAAIALWTRLSALGEISRGFVTVRTEVWAFVQGERYGALVLAERSVRPGQVLELADQALAEAAAAAVLAGGADRRTEAGSAAREPRSPSQRRFRLPLHREDRSPEHEPVAEALAADVLVSLDSSEVAGATMAAAGAAAQTLEPRVDEPEGIEETGARRRWQSARR